MTKKVPAAEETSRPDDEDLILIRNARQNNLKNLDLDLRIGEFTVVTFSVAEGSTSCACLGGRADASVN